MVSSARAAKAWTTAPVAGSALVMIQKPTADEGGPIFKLHDAGIPSADIEKLGESLEPGQAAAIAVADEGDQDKVREILYNQGGEVVSVGVTDDLKSALDAVGPEGVTVAEDGSSAETA